MGQFLRILHQVAGIRTKATDAPGCPILRILPNAVQEQ
jgi:hypothetical protein